MIGYSFGAEIAMKWAVSHPEEVAAVVAIAPPAGLPGLAQLTQPLLVIAADKDEVCPMDELRVCLPAAAQLAVIEGANHSFRGKIRELTEHVQLWAAGAMPS